MTTPRPRSAGLGPEAARELVERYVRGWRTNDLSGILTTLTPDCVVMESHGPTYRGLDDVEQWVRDWIETGSRVTRWDVLAFLVDGPAAAFEWGFECVVDGTRYALDGATVVRFDHGRIAFIHEYRMTEPSFDARDRRQGSGRERPPAPDEA